jgi:hypothetical protein
VPHRGGGGGSGAAFAASSSSASSSAAAAAASAGPAAAASSAKKATPSPSAGLEDGDYEAHIEEILALPEELCTPIQKAARRAAQSTHEIPALVDLIPDFAQDPRGLYEFLHAPLPYEQGIVQCELHRKGGWARVSERVSGCAVRIPWACVCVLLLQQVLVVQGVGRLDRCCLRGEW